MVLCLLAGIQDQLVVNLVGENDQIVAPRQFRQLFQHAAGADCAGGIIGIDQHNGAGARIDLALQVDQVRLPGVVFVQIVRRDRNAELAQHGGVERVVRTRSQNMFAGIDQGGQTDIHGFAGARSHERVLHRGNALARRLAANGFERLRNARRRRVAVLVLAHRLVDGFDQVRRSFEIKNIGIADVERQDLVALLA